MLPVGLFSWLFAGSCQQFGWLKNNNKGEEEEKDGQEKEEEEE